MKTAEPATDNPQRAENQRPPANDRKPEAPARARTLTHLVDPYDMSAEPPPEEPGYGHGV